MSKFITYVKFLIIIVRVIIKANVTLIIIVSDIIKANATLIFIVRDIRIEFWGHFHVLRTSIAALVCCPHNYTTRFSGLVRAKGCLI